MLHLLVVVDVVDVDAVALVELVHPPDVDGVDEYAEEVHHS